MSKFTKWRSIIGFWMIGLANHYPGVIMLSAAFDIIHHLSGLSETLDNLESDPCTLYNGSYVGREPCERKGTSVSVCVCVCVCVCEKTVCE